MKLDGIPDADFPARFVVTNSGCVEELIDCGTCRDDVVVTRSAHLESLSNRGIGKTGES